MRLARALAAILALSAIAPALANSRGVAPWAGTYQVQLIGGSQEASWTLSRPSGNPCLGGERGQGTDAQAFLPGAPAVAQLTGVGVSAFAASIAGVELKISEDRQGSITRGPSADSNPGDCIGEATESPLPSGSDCGTHTLTASLSIDPVPGTAAVGGSAEDPTPFLECPVFGEVAPAFASPVTSSMPPLGPASAGGPPSGDATLQATAPITDSGVSGSTTLRLQLRFTRLAVVEALAMAQDPTITASPSGSLDVPVSCPAGSCAGTITLGPAPNATVASVHAAALPRFPAPEAAPVPQLGSASFHLRAHQRGVRLQISGGAIYARALRGVQLAIYVSERSGRAVVRYIAGDAHVRT
jgi:hypothetical protein